MLNKLKNRLKRELLPPVLHEGEVAPDWSLTGHDGTPYSSDKSWTILVFYPKDNTPTCTSQLRGFNELYAQFTELNCRIFGVNPGVQSSHSSFAQQLELQFPLLIDDGAKLARQYQSLVTLPVVGDRIIRTVYLINPVKTIRLANRGTPHPEIVLRSIIALQQASSTAM